MTAADQLVRTFPVDKLVLTPDDIDLTRSPMAGQIDAETYVLGAFNLGLTRLPNGNLLLMVRVAEALREPVFDGQVHAIRWDSKERHVLDGWRSSTPTPPIRASSSCKDTAGK
jgi:beta-1,2-mannobiose phosphorylase / 1,2-beta-oligomannan phosphorylase